MDEAKVEEFLKLLENPATPKKLRATIEHVLSVYFTQGADAAEQELLRLMAKDDLDAFSTYVFGFPPFVHHREITKALQDETKKRLLIVVSPGHAKSTYVSLCFPAWYIGREPNKCVLMMANTVDQVERFTGEIRSTIKSEFENKYLKVFPEVTPDEDKGWTRTIMYLGNRTKAVPYPNIMASGMTASGTLGTRADLIIVDDPITEKNARSESELANFKSHFKNTIMTRLKPDGRIISILTRWHQNDLAAMMVNDLNFEVIHMPGLGNENGAYVDYVPSKATLNKKGEWVQALDPEAHIEAQLQKRMDEAEAEGFRAERATSRANGNRPCVRKYLHEDNEKALWPEEHSAEALEQKQREIGSVQFRLVYQGDSTGISGDVFKRDWIRYWGPGEAFEQVPADCTYFQSVDVAVGQNKRNDYFVILTVAVDSWGNKFIVDRYRGKLEAPKQRRKVAKEYLKYPQTLWVLIEATAYQVALFQELATIGIPVHKFTPVKNKQLRAESASVFFEQGKVYFPSAAPWLDEFRDEFTEFPKAEHDDQVDALSNLLEELSGWGFEETEYEVGFG